MALTETENNAFYKILGLQTKSIIVCYGIFWSGQLALLLTIITIILFLLDLFLDSD